MQSGDALAIAKKKKKNRGMKLCREKETYVFGTREREGEGGWQAKKRGGEKWKARERKRKHQLTLFDAKG